MAGIAVVYGPSHRYEETEALIPQMCRALRRSDREGAVEWYGHPGFTFAMGRCRPLLINQAPQPAWNEKRTVCAFFHGEIFGYEGLKRSLERKGHRLAGDSHAEFVVHLYEDRGDAFVHELDGGFALALWDSRHCRLIVANDRYGLRPLYTARSDGQYLWASAPKAILAAPSFPRQVNLAAMADHLCLSTPQGNDTIFEGIDELPPASLVICQEGQVRHRQYWDLKFQEEETRISAGEYLDEFIPLLQQSAERLQAGELSVGLLLSGGFDSRLILSVLNKDAVKAFTLGTLYCDDVRFARQAARVAHVPHFVLDVNPNYLEAFAWTAVERAEDLINCDQFTGIGVYDQVAPLVDVLLMGHVGEDMLGHFNRDPRSEFWGHGFSVDRYYETKSFMTDEELGQLVKPAHFRQMKGLARARFHRDFERCSSRHVIHRADYWGVRQQQRRLFNRLAASLLPDSLEWRPFYFCNDLVDFAQTIPPSLRWGENSVYRQAILRTAPEMASVPATTTKGLPLYATHAEVARNKDRRRRLRQWHHRVSRITMGLIPSVRETNFYADYDGWLKRELRDWAESILLDPQTLDRDYWNPSAVARLVEAHRQSKPGTGKDLARQLTALISLELWHRMYVD